MSGPDPQQALKQAQALQERMAALQRELASRRIEGSAGGGMVTAVVSGDLRVLEIRIEPSLVDAGDRDMIQDLCAAAVNSAITTAQRTVQQEIQRVAGGLAFPGMPGMPTITTVVASPPVSRNWRRFIRQRRVPAFSASPFSPLIAARILGSILLISWVSSAFSSAWPAGVPSPECPDRAAGFPRPRGFRGKPQGPPVPHPSAPAA